MGPGRALGDQCAEALRSLNKISGEALRLPLQQVEKVVEKARGAVK